MKIEDIRTAGIVGGGTMGFGIALNFALAGFRTIVRDVSDEALDGTLRESKKSLDMFVEEELYTRTQADDALGRLTLTTDLEELGTQSDFITEAIVERLPDKQNLFRELDAMAPGHAIIVSNTSGFTMREIAEGVERKAQTGLTHYFAPPHIVPGVEVAKGPGMSEEDFELICSVLQKTGRIPIRLRKEEPGYLLNRIQGAAGREACRLWAEGMATPEDIELGVQTTFGFRYPHEGPFLHYDLAGIWKWPSDAGPKRSATGSEDEIAQKIRERMSEGKPWFLDPEKFDEAVEKRDREFIRRLKVLYPRSDS